MRNFKKLQKLQQQKELTLNVRLPHVIKNKKDVEDLFVGNFVVKLPRQSSRSCHVVFSSMEEKIQNHKLARSKTINGKRVVVNSLNNIVLEKRPKEPRKKIFMPEIKPDIKVTQTIFISNIAINTKSDEIRGVLPGCISVALLKSYNNQFRSAIAKMESIKIAAEYLKKERQWPLLNGNKMYMKADTRKKHKRRASAGRKTREASPDTIKIYDGDTTEEHKSGNRRKLSKCTENDDKSD